MPIQSVAHTVMELTLAIAAAANATYDNPNRLAVTLTGPSGVEANQVVELSLRIDAGDKEGITALGAVVDVPEGWEYEGLGAVTSGFAPDIDRHEPSSDNIAFAWIENLDDFPYAFKFRVMTPEVLDGATIRAHAEYRTSGPAYNSETVALNLLAADTTPPVIVLRGGEILALEVGEAYEDPGWVATDDMDGDISDQVVVEGLPNPSLVGDYIVTYNVTDAAGNAAIQKTRLVQVVEPNTTAKGFFLCGTGSHQGWGSADWVAVLLTAAGLLALRRRPTRFLCAKQNDER